MCAGGSLSGSDVGRGPSPPSPPPPVLTGGAGGIGGGGAARSATPGRAGTGNLAAAGIGSGSPGARGNGGGGRILPPASDVGAIGLGGTTGAAGACGTVRAAGAVGTAGLGEATGWGGTGPLAAGDGLGAAAASGCLRRNGSGISTRRLPPSASTVGFDAGAGVGADLGVGAGSTALAAGLPATGRAGRVCAGVGAACCGFFCGSWRFRSRGGTRAGAFIVAAALLARMADSEAVGPSFFLASSGF